MRVEQTFPWKDYKRKLRRVINLSISQAIGDLDRIEREITKERLKRATDQLDSLVYTYMKIGQIARREGKEYADGTKKRAGGNESGSRPGPPY